MHASMYVLLSKERAKTSEDARRFVFDWLAENGFVEQGVFCGGIADWYTIGGRFSGILKAAKNSLPELPERDTYAQVPYGHEDDAMVVDEVLYERFVKDNIGHHDFGSLYDGGKVVDVEFFEEGVNTTSENTIGKKWIVVVDFHF